MQQPFFAKQLGWHDPLRRVLCTIYSQPQDQYELAFIPLTRRHLYPPGYTPSTLPMFLVILLFVCVRQRSRGGSYASLTATLE